MNQIRFLSIQSHSFHYVIHTSSIIPILTLMALWGSVSSQFVLFYYFIWLHQVLVVALGILVFVAAYEPLGTTYEI